MSDGERIVFKNLSHDRSFLNLFVSFESVSFEYDSFYVVSAVQYRLYRLTLTEKRKVG
ncbi:hypothetical protein GCM10022277_37500 [Litoribacillus peritrichatus]|uniref:Uncharacterized protein n=1 Tax=Litoribacillus peritrichatus TaxID=718191 RepID=A0ABP7N5T0_9GAMM